MFRNLGLTIDNRPAAPGARAADLAWKSAGEKARRFALPALKLG